MEATQKKEGKMLEDEISRRPAINYGQIGGKWKSDDENHCKKLRITTGMNKGSTRE